MTDQDGALNGHQEEEDRIDREIVRKGSGPDPFAAAVRATRMPMIITDPRLDDNPIVFVNEAFLRLTGYSRDELIGRNCRFLQGPGTNRDDVAKVREAIAAVTSIEIELLNYRKDGSTFWNRLLLSPVFHDGELTYFFASQFDVTSEKSQIHTLVGDRDTLEDELRQRIVDLSLAEERLRFTLQAGSLGFWTLDLRERRLVASPLCKQNFGRSVADTFTYDDLRSAIEPEHLMHWEEQVVLALQEPGELKVEYKIRTPEGDARWIEVRGKTAFDSHGEPISMSGVSIDITARRQAEEQRTLLAKELNHRVKNSLAMVQSIFSQTLRSASSMEQARTVVSARIQALADAQDVLIDQGWTRSEMQHVVASAMRPFQDAIGRIRFSGPRVVLSATAATALSLAFHELATNAVKYGALSNSNGSVTIRWKAEGETFSLTWNEAGGPQVKEPTRRGFGTSMIERALAASVGGSAKIDYASDGLVFTLVASLEGLKPDEKL